MLITEQMVKNDFRRLATAQEEDWVDTIGQTTVKDRVEYLVEYWFNRWLRATKNDDALKAIFALALDKYSVDDVLGMFQLADKTSNYVGILNQ